MSLVCCCPRSFQENLSLYAQLAVREGVALQPGQELIVSAELEAAPLVRLVVEEAYRAGAKNVEVLWRDSEVALARFREGSDEAITYAPQWLYDGITQAHRDGAARLGILSEDPSLLAGQPADKVANHSRAQSQAKKEMSELITGSHFNWSLIGAAGQAWACRVFPDLDSNKALEKLWEAIFLTSRVLESDPIAAWVSHSESLEARRTWLNGLKLNALHFKGPGTDLRVGLAEGHVWEGGRGKTKNGIVCSPNIPTEEVFTMPHRDRVDGHVASSMPLSLRGQLVEGIRVEFKDGRVADVNADRGLETIQRLLDADEGARHLGEVALVPASAKVAQTGILFFNTLYDENAASHIALGACYGDNMAGYEDLSESERLHRGANDSIIHVDWMIGSNRMDVDGLRSDGSSIALMRSGEWVS